MYMRFYRLQTTDRHAAMETTVRPVAITTKNLKNEMLVY